MRWIGLFTVLFFAVLLCMPEAAHATGLEAFLLAGAASIGSAASSAAAAAASALAVAGSGIAAAGSALGVEGAAALLGGGAAATGTIISAKTSSDIAKAQAQAEIERAKADVFSNTAQSRELISSQIAASTGGLGGSAGEIIGGTAFKTSFENELIRSGAQFRAGVQRAAGRSALLGGAFEGAGQLITSGVRASQTMPSGAG